MKNIAILTAGILAVGLFGIASYTGSVWAASTSGTANFNGAFASHAAANPGAAVTSSGGANIVSPSGGVGIGTSSGASDSAATTAPNSAAGSTVVCPNHSGVGSTAVAGSCAAASNR